MAYQARHRDPLFDSDTQAIIERRGKELIGVTQGQQDDADHRATWQGTDRRRPAGLGCAVLPRALVLLCG